MLGLSRICQFNLIFNVNSNLAESSANCSGQYLLTNWLVGHIIPGAGVRRGGSGEKSEIFIVKFVRRKVHPEEHFFRKIDLWKKGS